MKYIVINLLVIFILSTMILAGCGVQDQSASTFIAIDPIKIKSEEDSVSITDLPIENPFENAGRLPLPPVYQELHTSIHAWAESALRPNESLYWPDHAKDFISPSARYVIIDHPLDHRIVWSGASIDLSIASRVRSRMWVIDNGSLRTVEKVPVPAWQISRNTSSDKFIVTSTFGLVNESEKRLAIKVFRVDDSLTELMLDFEFLKCIFISVSNSGNCVGMSMEGDILFGKVVKDTIKFNFSVAPNSLSLTEHWRSSIGPTTPVWNKNGDVVLLCEQAIVSAETGKLIKDISSYIEVQPNDQLSDNFIGLVKKDLQGLPQVGTLLVGSINNDGSIKVIKTLGRWSKIPYIYNVSPNAQRAAGRTESPISKLLPIPGAPKVFGHVLLDSLKRGKFEVEEVNRRVIGWVTVSNPKD